LVIDFHLKQHGLLFTSVEPAAPRLYLMKSSLRDLERKSISPSPFLLALKSALATLRYRQSAKMRPKELFAFVSRHHQKTTIHR